MGHFRSLSGRALEIGLARTPLQPVCNLRLCRHGVFVLRRAASSESMTKILKMGTRGSALALAQARQFAATLEFFHPDLKVEEHIIRTTGDKNQASPLPQIGGKGVFTLEIEAALLN
ncbi:hypothetical protein EON83_29190, partial [bacterium]